MVLWHTGDGWLASAQREGEAWLALRFVGGLAAPSFLFLAGCAAALASRPAEPPHMAQVAFRKSAARALEVLLLGYVLRLQTWLIDAGALLQLGTLRAWLPLGAGYAALFWSAGQLAKAPKKAAAWASAGVALSAAGLAQVESVAPGRFARLLQVDVLQAIGASLLILALAQRALGLLNRPAVLLALSLLVAGLTSSVTEAMPGVLPAALAGYLGKFTAEGAPVPASLFPLFPWLAYALAGASVGALLRGQRGEHERTLVALAVAGACLAILTSEAQPYVHRALVASPWLAPPVRMAFRVGLVLTLMMVGWLWTSAQQGRLLVTFGQTSLRLYWGHMFFAYGVFGRLLQDRMSFLGWALGLMPLFVGLWFLARLGSQTAQRAPRVVHT